MQRKCKTLAKASLEADVKRHVIVRESVSCVTEGLQVSVILSGRLVCARVVGMAGFLEAENLIWIWKTGSSSSR